MNKTKQDNKIPLSKTEYGIYLEFISNPKSTAYNLPLFLTLDKNTDTEKLRKAVETTIENHSYLKSKLYFDNDGNVYKKISEEPVNIEIKEISDSDFNKADYIYPFDLLNDKLYRISILKLESSVILFCDIHHIIFDRYSLAVFFDDIDRAFNGLTLVNETYTANDVSREESERLLTSELQDAKKYYNSVFGGLEVESVPFNDKKDGVPQAKKLHFDFETFDADTIREFAHKLEIKTSTFFDSVFGFVLSKFSGAEESLFATVFNGRYEKLKRTCGMFVKTMPLYCNIQKTDDIEQYLKEIDLQIDNSRKHNLYSYSDICSDLHISPQVLFSYQGDVLNKISFCGSETVAEFESSNDPKEIITFEIYRNNGKFYAELEYRTDLFNEESMQILLCSYEKAISEFLRKLKLSEVEITDSNQISLLDSFNATEDEYEKTDIVTLLRQQAKQNPDNTAVVYLDKSYNYKETDGISEKVGAYITSLGIGKEDVVSVLIPRCEYIVLASLGVLKSGAAYQPLDPSYPQERLEFMMKDASAKLLITSKELLSLVPNYSGKILFIEDIPDLPDCNKAETNPNPDDLFIMLYTSGSTGTPKGCMLEHRNIVSFCNWYRKYYNLTSESRVAAYASYGFDANMMDMYPALTTGAAVYIIDESIRLDLIAIDKYFDENGITHSFMTTQVGRQFALETNCKSLQHLSVGGERLVPVAVNKNFKFYNLYGPTECTIITTAFPVDKLYDRVPIGKGLYNTKLYVVDKYGRRVPPCVPGELWVAGHGVSRGYLNRPEQNEKVFIKNPFTNEKGYERVYRTGDIVRFLPGGNIDFVGRNDGQVKIRGFRIELSEVERIIREFDGIKDATVAAFDEPGGGKFVAAYVVSDEKIDIKKLNEFILENKPPYMVPAVTMQIDKIPLNQNQKVNKRALPIPQKQVEDIIAPENEIQQRIFDCISEVIGTDNFGITTDIFYAGLTSIGAIKLNVLLSKAFDVAIKINDLKENNTVKRLEKFLSNSQTAEKYDILSDYPITQTQNGIFVECAANPGTTIYNIPYLLKLSKNIDINRLKAAVESTINAHPYIKTKLFINEKGDIRALRNDSDTPLVEIVECEELPENSELVIPFEILNGNLYRAKIYKTNDANYLFLEFHHIICDGTSEAVIIEDINSFYEGKAVEAESYTGFENALDEEKARTTEAYTNAKKYYDSIFNGCDTGFLPVKDKNEPLPSVGRCELECDFSVEDIKNYCDKINITLNAFFNGVFGFVLSKYNYKDEALFTTIYNGRNDSRLSRAVTMLVKTFPVHCNIDGEKKIADLLIDTKNQLIESMSNDIYSFAEISRAYDIKADIMFAYQGDSFEFDSIGGEKAESVVLGLDTAKAPISIGVFIKNGKFEFVCEYRSDMYNESTIMGMAECLSVASQEFLRKLKLSEVEITDSNQISLLDSFNATEDEYEKTDIVTLLRQQAKQNPDNTAVVYLDKSYNYKETDGISEKVGAYITSLGIGKEDVVSVLIPRCEYIVLASLGVLKSGAAYQPLDPSYPQERLEFMMKDASAKLLITSKELLSLVPNYSGKILFIEDIPDLPDCNKAETNPNPDDLFIMLYTSGSTGTPKGCMLEHRNIVSFCNWYRKYYNLTSESRVAAYASYGFDANMMDMYPALTTGAAVYIIDESIRLDLIAIDKYFDENGITHSFMTTQVGRQFALETNCKSLQHLSVGGERLVPVAVNKNFKFYNLYGPTECTIITTAFPVDKLYDRVPIGKGLYNTKLYVVDKYGRRVPPCVPGELWVAGHGVSRGYLNRPEQNEKVFIKNPFTNEKGYERVYRTGDIVRFLPGGNIDFVGRNDGQVKIRGFRIELSEVERIIREFDGIKDATVAAFDEPGGGKFVAAYVVSDEKIDIKKLNEFILENKPPYMVPAVTMQIDKIPLNQNQKVNKRALPIPQKQVEDIIAPENEIQQRIFDCISEVIGTDNFGITTDIFYAGLTSIGAIKLNVLLSKAFDVAIKINDLKENNTVKRLEKFLSNSQTAEKYDILSDYPITQTQNGIFVECAANPGTTIYNIPYLLKLSKNIDINRLKAAVESTINAHPYIKTKLFINEKGDIRALRNDSDTPLVEIVECEELPENSELVIPFEILNGNLYRAKIYKTNDANYLFLEFHHIICDGTSEAVIIEDINSFYEGKAVEAESYTGFENALDEEKARTTEAYTNAKKYYDSIFNGCDTGFLPVKDKNEPLPSVGRCELECDFSVEDIKNYCDKINITLNAFFNGVFGFVLSKYNYKDEALFTTIYNGRNDSRLSRAVTMLVKTFPVHCNIDGEKKIADLLIDTKNQLIESMSNDIYSFAEISRAYDIKADIMFAYQGDSFEFDSIGGEKAESVVLGLDTAKAPISIDVFIKNGKFEFVCEYRSDMYNESTIMGMAECLSVVSQEFLKKTYIKEVSMLSSKAEEKIESFNSTDYPISFVPVHQLFEAQVAQNGENTAFIAAGKKLSYSELNSEANKIANSLIEKGLQLGEPVGIILPRTTDVPAAEYGIMKAGGAFLPMLPDYPDERIDYCLKDSKSRFVITTEEIKQDRKELFKDKPYTVLTVNELTENTNTENPNVNVPVDSLVYIIYTSGSTGTPKGVMIEHRNLCNFVNSNPLNYETLNFVSFGKTALSVASISFDFSLMEIHIPLCNGMAVCMAGEEEIHNPLALFKLIRENDVDVVSGTPSFITSFIDLPQAFDALSGIKMYDMGAEAFPASLYKKMHKASPEAVIVNGYGPTEATISCISKVMDGKGAVTIGKPSANVRAYICDTYGNILPQGVKGELVICGDGVGSGYVNLPEKTADVFVTLNGRKAYRSGDLARYNKDGEIEFFGRLDNQVKLRGFRIELDEIENVMNDYPMVIQSVVLVKENAKAGQFLCGYFTASETVDKEKLTEHMKRSLTYYMIPSVLIQLDTFPLTPNGKINKKALPEPDFTVKERKYIAPKNDLQKKLCDMFANVLGTDKVGVDENFFEIGGTSLSASKIAMLAIIDNLPIAYGDIFDNPTVEMLEQHILNQQSKSEKSEETQEEVVLDGVDKVLAYNTVKYVDEIEYTDIGDVLLTGATGFLGVHVLNEIIKHTQSKVYCLVRKGKANSIESRLKNMLVYYFSDGMDDLFGKRIIPIEGDITDKEIVSSLEKYDFKTVINCAACVKHFTNDDTLERINVHGVENLISMCIKTGRRLVQISTTSVAGVNVNRKFPPEKKIHENELYFGQDLTNKYIDTKFRGEKAVLEAIASDELDGKIIRVGNLMSRNSDGEFQVNANTNGFMRFLRAYATIGKFPVSSMDEAVEFSPIDCTAAAVICLAGTNSKFTVFQACNGHNVEMGDVVELLNKCGIKIEVVKDEEFIESLNEVLKDEKKNMLISGLISYATSDNDKTEEFIGYDNSFTTKALYRLGFKWPIINEKYLANALDALATLGFFDGRLD